MTKIPLDKVQLLLTILSSVYLDCVVWSFSISGYFFGNECKSKYLRPSFKSTLEMKHRFKSVKFLSINQPNQNPLSGDR
jgi:hypothetical protein